ncbi:MAG: metal-dependent transcriptional regulator [Methanocalculus sp. MSAO_Arc1]|uniref:metal-dependent transcriptional regulator n=1 Tax=Methanocalculus TaxID=71151 RepID=UPI000FF60460|nr:MULTISPECIES: iron dependent repressor, metal binding and dimerization domain protein [unclassified Methanocalculus]MCP1662895.1 DtxR family Mn-dependent transcriptional regulator [Methanocalculus sp. AMF5]RQD80043.1 MAG: metal-dependent transcriptional regulator [Methanocalculus sp. MSAO_Arc1]
MHQHRGADSDHGRQRGCSVNNLSRKAEDYLEAIYRVASSKGYARTKDVALELGVRPSTVVEMFRKLHSFGLLEYRRYEGVVLRPEGEKIGRTVHLRHETLKEFLLLLRVPERVAEEDACFMEHELHPETIQQIRTLLDCLAAEPDAADALRRHLTAARLKEL